MKFPGSCFSSEHRLQKEERNKPALNCCCMWKNMVSVDFGADMAELNLTVDLILKSCATAVKSHENQDKQYRLKKRSQEAIFAFPRRWSVDDWIGCSSFGNEPVDSAIFPSLRYIGLKKIANVHGAFLKRFKAVLDNPRFIEEVKKAVKDGKRVVFTGHNYGGAIAILATAWFLDEFIRSETSKNPPLCMTFGSPLVGDHIMSHAIRRENWSRYFIHFIMSYDVVPRILLSPFSSDEQKQQLQQILGFFGSPARQESGVVTEFFDSVMRNTSSVASYAACKMTGSTSPLLETMSGFVELSPYRPSGTYVFLTGNENLLVVKNPDAILQLLFYSLQTSPQDSAAEIAQGSLKDHMNYEGVLREYLNMISVTHLDRDVAIPLSSNEESVIAADISKALNSLNLSSRARLCLRAAALLEKQKQYNQERMNQKKKDKEKGIEVLLGEIEKYKKDCAEKKIGYFDAFKLSKEAVDFHANVNRLELAGIWDEIEYMLKRNELPEGFERQKEWIELGTRFRRLVEPLDIANFYRHMKNEDTGAYMKRGRPKRYKIVQRWLEYDGRLQKESLESCFWAEVEELRNKTGQVGVKQNVANLAKQVNEWIKDGNMKKEDVTLENSSYMKLLKEYSPTDMHNHL